MIEVNFKFQTPIFLDGKNLGNATFTGTGATFEDDADLCFIVPALEFAEWDCSDTDYTRWLMQGDLTHMIKEHVKFLIGDMTKKGVSDQDFTTDLQQYIAA